MTKTKKTVKTKKVELPKELPVMSESTLSCSSSCCCGLCGMSKTKIIAIILGAIIVLLIAINRGWIVSAVVNGKPIFRTTLTKTLVSRYGQQTLENIITEKLIAEEAKKANIKVTQEEIDKKEEEILKSFGGNVTLEEVLKFQGMTKADFDEQVKLQMLLTRLIGKDVVITDEDISAYRATNSATIIATDEAAIKEEIKETILTQKVGEKIQPWFTELRGRAKIFKFAQ